MISLKVGGIIVAAFIAGAFIASPELRAFAANTVYSTDIVDGEVKTVDLASNAVTAAKIKDSEVKALEIASNAVGPSEIATNAVGAAELQGVTKLVFTACSVMGGDFTVSPSGGVLFQSEGCSVSGLTESDRVIVTKEFGNPCFVVSAVPRNGWVDLHLLNACSNTEAVGTITFSVIVYRIG